ncbi:hypothetical protein ALHIDCOG_00403 [Klebsiella phage CPRSB]|nr:hypothetical protein ALHIDCOG_00403 [Klebsiella phage CPRSB]
MAKLTKAETKQHNQIMDLVHSDKALTYEEKLFIIENFHEGAFTNNSELGRSLPLLDLLAISQSMLAQVEVLLTCVLVSVGYLSLWFIT